LYPDIGSGRIEAILGVGAALTVVGVAGFSLGRKGPPVRNRTELQLARIAWRMPGLDSLGAVTLTPLRRTGMIVLRAYLVVAVAMVIARVIQTAYG
jgi:hypothetical protein